MFTYCTLTKTGHGTFQVEELSVSVTVVDSNTAAPRQVYLTEVPETFPVSVPIPSLYIGAAGDRTVYV